MLDADYIQGIPQNHAEAVAIFEMWVILRMSEDIAKLVRLQGTDGFARAKKKTIAKFKADYEVERKKFISQLNKITDDVFMDVALTAYVSDKFLFDFKDMKQVPIFKNKQIMSAAYKNIDEFKDIFEKLTKTSATRMTTKIGGRIAEVPISKFFTKTLDNAITKTANGLLTHDQAIKNAVVEMTRGVLQPDGSRVGGGIVNVIYDKNGKKIRRSVESVVRMNVMTQSGQMSNEISKINAATLGTTIFDISYHDGFRETHRWGGMRYDERGIDYPTADELFASHGGGTLNDVHCRHSISAAFKEIPPVYSKADIRERNAKNAETTHYKWTDSRGVKHERDFTLRDALDRQNEQIRQMRLTRKEMFGMDKAGMSKEYNALKSRYRLQMKQYKDFAGEMNIGLRNSNIWMDSLGAV